MPGFESRAFYPFFPISFAKYNWLLKKIHSPGSMPLRLRFPAGLWDRFHTKRFGASQAPISRRAVGQMIFHSMIQGLFIAGFRQLMNSPFLAMK